MDPAGPKGRREPLPRDFASDSQAPGERQKQTTQREGRGRSELGGMRESQVAQSQNNTQIHHHLFINRNKTKPSSPQEDFPDRQSPTFHSSLFSLTGSIAKFKSDPSLTQCMENPPHNLPSPTGHGPATHVNYQHHLPHPVLAPVLSQLLRLCLGSLLKLGELLPLWLLPSQVCVVNE